MSEEPKKFGLRITSKPTAATSSAITLPVASVFGNDEDSDTEIASEKDANKKFQMKYGSNRTRDQRAVDEAIAANPDVYLYDEIIDDLHAKRNAKTEEQKEADKKREPKYAHKIVLAAQKRQMEKLMVDERKQAKEREAEGEEFKDKEVFVTGAYKKQIEEREKIRKELDEQERMDSRLKVEDQSFWQANFHRRLLDDMTYEKTQVAAAGGKVEEKKEARSPSTVEEKKEARSPSTVEEKKEAQSRSPSKENRRNNKNRRHEKKKSSNDKPKSHKEVLYERLERVKEILKQRNSDSEIFMARQRYLQRKQNGEICAPI